MSKENKHNDNKDPIGTIISVVDTTGSVFLHPDSAIPATVAKGVTGQIISVHGVATGTNVVFSSQLAK